MPRVQLPPGCLGFKAADGRRIMAERGPGSFAHVDDKYMPALKQNDYAVAGLVDTGPEKFFTQDSVPGRWCRTCRFLGYAWMHVCSRCGRDTVPEDQMSRSRLSGQYIP